MLVIAASAAMIPVGRILFAPKRLRPGKGQGYGRIGDDRLAVVDEDGLDSGGSDIDAEIGHDGPQRFFAGTLRSQRIHIFGHSLRSKTPSSSQSHIVS